MMLRRAGVDFSAILGIAIVAVFIAILYLVCCSTGVDPDRMRVSSDLELSERPDGFSPDGGQLEICAAEGMHGIGSDKLLAIADPESGLYELRAFTQNASIADLSWMMTRIYNEVISPKICEGEPLAADDLAMIDLAMMAHSAFVHAATAQCLLNMFNRVSVVKGEIESYYLHCFVDSTIWDGNVRDVINTLCYKWMQGSMGRRAASVGKAFSGCDGEWLEDMVRRIKVEEIPDIRWPNLQEDDRFFVSKWIGDDEPDQMVSFDFRGANAFNRDWQEVVTVVYFESATALQRMNYEISRSLSMVRDVQGYPELHALIEKWRPYVKFQVGAFMLAYSDIPLTIINKAAYDQTKPHDKLFSTDRPAVKTIATQYAKSIVDGEMVKLSCSATSGHLMSHYHAYLQKLLGKGDYQNYINAIKWRKSDPLKYERN